MNRIIRLSRANIRKHRTESLLLAVLILFCMLLLGSAVSASGSIRDLLPEIYRQTGALKNHVDVPEQEFNELYTDFIAEDSRVERFEFFHCLQDMTARILRPDGTEQLFPVVFFTAENEQKFEQSPVQSALSDTEIAAMQHPIRLPFREQHGLALHEGDEFTVLSGAKRYTFTIAGFYESGVFDTEETKCIVSDKDYLILKKSFKEDAVIGFDTIAGTNNENVVDDFIAKCSEYAGKEVNVYYRTYEINELNYNLRIKLILNLLKIMALIIILSVAVMVRFRIINDIQDQIVSIGVLEAIGYTSKDIALSFGAEYLLIAAAGCTGGLLGSFALTPALIRLGYHMVSFYGECRFRILPFFAAFTGILLFTAGIAYLRARAVRKYPPVLAFRKGIRTHHFGKSRFPLRNTKRNVHLRLAVKGFADRAKQNIGLTFVLCITSMTVLISVIFFRYLGSGMDAMLHLAGEEMSDLNVTVNLDTDTDAFSAELLKMPEIRKIVPGNTAGDFILQCSQLPGKELPATVYADYSQTENIFPAKGRMPVHDNEIALSTELTITHKLNPGDSIMLNYNGIEMPYLLTGSVSALTNSEAVFLTDDGMRRLDPTYCPSTLHVYLHDSSTRNTVLAKLDQMYGKSIGDLSKDTTEYDSYEDRIRNAAEKQIASLMQQSGATYVSYAIRSGDTLITGDSSAFRILDCMSLPELYTYVLSSYSRTIAAATFLMTAISAAVVMIIFFILMESEIRRQRRELGIMKGLGYTSKELMLQLAFRIVPAVVAAVCIGTALTVLAVKYPLFMLLGDIPYSFLTLLLTGLCILAFCFVCAYSGARIIKKISVCELMTE